MKNGKKYFVSILVILLVVAMLLTLTCCNKKKQEEQKRKEEASVAITTSEDFTVLDDGTLYCGVENGTDKYILKGKFTVPGGATIKCYETADGETPGKEITNLTISLKEGQNILLAVVRNGKASKTYKVDLYRKMHVTVTFDTPSHEVPSQTLIEGECAVEPTVIPTRLGYKFVGWKFDFAEPIFENVTVKAMWEAEAYTITYEPDGGILYDEKGEVVTGNTQKVHYGENVKYYVPLKEGYQFQGWYVGDYKQSDGEWKRLSDATFTAHWSIMSLDVKVTPNLKGAGDITGEGDYNYNDECTLSVSPYNGYRFLGWYDKHGELLTENFTYTVILKESNIRVDARFKTVLPEMEPYLFDTDDEVHYIVKGMRNNALTEIEIPECVVGIREGSFNVNALQKLTIPFIGTDEKDAKNSKTLNSMFSDGIPSSLTTVHVTGECYVNNSTFSNAQNLTTLTFDDVRRIEKEAFLNNRYLTKLEVSDSIEFVGEYIFYDHRNYPYYDYELVNFNAFNEYGNGLYLGNDENPYAVFYKEKVENQSTCDINANTKVIASNAFNYKHSGSNALSVTLPTNLKSVGDYAFYNRKMSSINIPTSLKNIGNNAFNCSLQNGTMNITFGNELETIGENAFNSCYSIKSVILPDSLTSLGGYAFNSCINLSSVTIGKGLKQIKNYTFYNNSFASVTIPDNIETINDYAFCNCSSLTSVTIGKGLKNISRLAFHCDSSSYRNISTITISNENENLYGENCIIDRATDKLIFGTNKAVLPEGLKEIGDSAFHYGKITSIVIPATVTKIGQYAFYSCDSLSSVTFAAGSGLKEIEYEAFCDCDILQSISLPDGVEKMGDCAFAYCDLLQTVSLPD
ncbi:MAG: leucine-rich repeat protein, partial [Clostridia bacterium]|nr:leucine-rich repeat protein [Clostridia bacterium]